MTDQTHRPTTVDDDLDRAVPQSPWLDTDQRPAPRPPLDGDTETDLVVVGGGFTGLWTALRAVEREPGRRVLLLEADRIAEHATGRNGGFCEASLTHGEVNGRERWPAEFDQLQRLGLENLAGIGDTVQRYGIDCGFSLPGMLTVATRPHEVAGLEPGTPGFLDAAAVRALVHSPTYLAGRVVPEGSALVDPARLAWGLARAAESLGVHIAEGTRVTDLTRRSGQLRVTTSSGTVTAAHVVLATNAFRPLLARLRFHTVPVYDYVLATEPLSAEQLASIGWEGRQGIADSGNQFHYYRLTDDDRVLWGGYDAIYHFGRRIDSALEDRRATHRLLAEQFYETFPQLAGVRFTHRWGGVIDTSTRFAAMFGSSWRGRVAYALGFTGLGVGASRFAADVLLDLLSGRATERTRLEMVRRRPLPFPPEPLAWIGIQLTRWSLNREDATGRRNLWMRALDRLGLGFDS
ncbi:Glycine/D-amino acid oxidase [Klenkia soli]|uniref:Glycine/D-amino acid oxidase n=1 Tax=Klenkia soli TaxID=1052260 RepID=A0A1H0GMR4_9ACTN|nr:FAD-binding oxidoreductase [Klenkia soli]SDO08180.1 Glycine/D-amino acid oxidase [Klenkia soli]